MNTKIQEARDTALALLKVDRVQIERGLELHANSIVCDAYGFAPHAAINGGALKKTIGEGASPAEITDLREEMLMTRYVKDKKQQDEFKEAFDASGVTCIIQNAGAGGQTPERLLKYLARYTYVCDMLKGFVRKAVTPDDIVKAKEVNKHCLYFSLNGIPTAERFDSVEEELRFIRIFFQLGVRMMHVTYNRRNFIGDGCAETSDAGLSDFGRQAIKEMNRVGVIIDVAHSGWKTSLESARVSTKPVVASHSACFAFCKHYRCKPDDVIEVIADKEGYIGICCIPSFLGRTGDIAAFLDHIDYAVKNFGIDHVAIGTDTAYQSRFSKNEEDKISQFPKQRDNWDAFWPPAQEIFDPGDREKESCKSLAWTNWPIFTVGLVQRGYSDRDIQKIIGGNVLRVTREVLRS